MLCTELHRLAIIAEVALEWELRIYLGVLNMPFSCISVENQTQIFEKHVLSQSPCCADPWLGLV